MSLNSVLIASCVLLLLDHMDRISDLDIGALYKVMMRCSQNPIPLSGWSCVPRGGCTHCSALQGRRQTRPPWLHYTVVLHKPVPEPELLRLTAECFWYLAAFSHDHQTTAQLGILSPSLASKSHNLKELFIRFGFVENFPPKQAKQQLFTKPSLSKNRQPSKRKKKKTTTSLQLLRKDSACSVLRREGRRNISTMFLQLQLFPFYHVQSQQHPAPSDTDDKRTAQQLN